MRLKILFLAFSNATVSVATERRVAYAMSANPNPFQYNMPTVLHREMDAMVDMDILNSVGVFDDVKGDNDREGQSFEEGIEEGIE